MLDAFRDATLTDMFDRILHLALMGGVVALLWQVQGIVAYNEELIERRDEVLRLQTLSYETALQNNKFLFENQELILNLGAQCGAK